MKTVKASILSIAILSSTTANGQAAGGAASAIKTAGTVGIAAATAAGAFGKVCPSPTGQWACPLAALSALQFIGSSKTKSGAQVSYAQLTDTPIPASNFDTQPTTYKLADGSVITGDSAKGANALNAEGLPGLAETYAKSVQNVDASGTSVSADGSKVTLPNGKKVDTSSFSTPEGMKSAGMSDADIQAMNDSLAGISKATADNQSKVAALTNEQGGGGGGLGSRGGSDAAGSGAGGYGDPFGKNKLGKAGDKGVSGMSKKLGNDNIGVAGDDIFEMISRRYQSRDKVDSFLKN